MNKKATIQLLVIALFVGCGIFLATDDNSSVNDALNYNEAATSMVVQLGTMKAIERVDAITADGVVQFVDDIDDLFTGDPITITQAFTVIRSRIPWDQFDQTEKLIVTGLIDTIEMEISRRVKIGEVNPDSITSIQRILEYVKRGAALAEEPAR